MENPIHQLLQQLVEYSEKKAHLDIESQKSQQIISDLHNQIIHLGIRNVLPSEGLDLKPYARAGGIPTKVLNILGRNRVCLTSLEIFNLMQVYNDKIIEKQKVAYIKSQIDDCLSKYTKKGSLRCFKPVNTSEFVYGLKEWFDSEGRIMMGYNI